MFEDFLIKKLEGPCLFAAAAVFVFMPLSYADWKQLDPGGGGWCMGIYTHPTDSNIVWMNTDISGLFKSTDGGTTYKIKSTPIHVATGGGHIMCGNFSQFTIDPTSPNTCYYAANAGGSGVHDNGLWKSVDGGETWALISGSDSLFGASIKVDFNGILYCAQQAGNKIWVSPDKGARFTVKATLPFTVPALAGSYQSSINLAVSKSNRLYISNPLSSSTGLYYSENMGNTWTPVAAFSGLTVAAVACSPTDPNLTIAVTKGGAIYRAPDGKAFSLCTGTLSVSGYDGVKRNVGVGIGKSGRVVAWANGMSKPLISDNNGQTFVNTIAQSPTNGDYVFFSNGSMHLTGFAASPCSDRFYKTVDAATFQSLDNGVNWTARVKGILILCVVSPPVVDRSNLNRVLYMAADVGYYYTTDLGNSWHIDQGAMGQTWCKVAGMTQDPVNDSTFYRVWSGVDDAVDPCHLYKSIDKGVTWAKIATANMGPRYRELGSLIADPSNPLHFYYSSTKNSTYSPAPPDSMFRVWESTDGGAHFRLMPGSPLQLHNLQLAASGNLYGVAGLWGSAVYKYTKSSGQWASIYSSGATDVAVDPSNENNIFIADWWAGKLMKSTTGGSTGSWVAKKDSLGRDICANAVYIDPVRPSAMLLMAHNINGGAGGMMRSLDYGEHWSGFQGSYGTGMVHGFVYGGIPGRVFAWSIFAGSYVTDSLYTASSTGIQGADLQGPAPSADILNVRYVGPTILFSTPKIKINGVLLVFSTNGRRVARMPFTKSKEISWHTTRVPAGCYLARFSAGEKDYNKKVIVLK